MKIITSHINLDFDGLASMVACSKLYPENFLVFSGRINNDIKEFLSLYKNILPIKSSREISIEDIQELIIVDVNSSTRIGKFKDCINDSITIKIYDHHEENRNTIKNASKIIKPYGACSTILVEELKKKKVPITSFEATLFLLGIYSDTNCLTFSSTKSEDADAVAFLLRNGADLKVVLKYIQRPFNNQHDQLFLALLLNMETININNYSITLATHHHDNYIGELGYLANKMLEVKESDAVFLIVEMDSRCYIIGRSSNDAIIIPNLLEEFKGAGHSKAASATVKNGDINQIKSLLIKNLHNRVKPQVTARDFMNYPVKTVREEMSIEEVNKIMLRYGHTGMPVIKDDDLIGIISRTDIDKAMQHGLSHAPVKGFMASDVKTIGLDTSLKDINELLVKNNIGRLPVVENNKIVGIVTRTDLLRMLHGTNHPNWYKKTFNESESTEIINCKEKILNLSKEISDLLKTTGGLADTLGKKVYVVGGFVRDLLLNRENFDIDFVIEGDGISFAERLNETLSGTLMTHKEFGTASITLANGSVLDIVSARREYYEYPAALPTVEKSSIWNDLFRRDFTINCMAIQINIANFGKLIDFFGGLEDIRNKRIRVLYNLSFIEDPTRIFRAIRFASRLDFEIEEQTKSFIMEAIKDHMLTKVTNDRVREEMAQIFTDKGVSKSIFLMKSFNIFTAIHSDLNITNETITKIDNLWSTIEKFHRFDNKKIDIQLLVIMQLFHSFPLNKLSEAIQKFLNNKQGIVNIQIALKEKEKVYTSLLKDDIDKYTIYSILHNHCLESLIFYYNDCTEYYIKHYIMYYMINLKNIKLKVTGRDLLNLGIQPGPIYKKILDTILKSKVMGEIYDEHDEIEYANKLYNELKEIKDV
ncbi:tRNA nucleotidyltransferase (CCA-adding enzyme) [Natronincola peptidivorans]|uniref:tRNA nucleotidyltransferase (CCA-adding enzyme) n=1 Tax=Natronincola peptidivorans TaxID=426128 RepID=A0A1H9YMJ1_9FIRM|nr:CBS domain-containing protein [Natronincola peptidivorans]SES70253.1 tRNA nucleotidyltransferase (CCA-adding enzyme) [Natronincola peptidivorans]